MTARKKYLEKEFKVGGLLSGNDYANIVPEDWINQQTEFYGDLIGTIPTGDLSAAATDIVVPFTDPAFLPRRSIRLNYELIPITAVTVTYTVRRGFNGTHIGRHQARNTPVFNAEGQLITFLTVSMGPDRTDVTMVTGAVNVAVPLNAILTLERAHTGVPEDVRVTAVSTALTVTRGADAIAHTAPHEVRNENGPYSLDKLIAKGGLLYVAMVDAN